MYPINLPSCESWQLDISLSSVHFFEDAESPMSHAVQGCAELSTHLHLVFDDWILMQLAVPLRCWKRCIPCAWKPIQ